jgi:hypothetical protein
VNIAGGGIIEGRENARGSVRAVSARFETKAETERRRSVVPTVVFAMD